MKPSSQDLSKPSYKVMAAISDHLGQRELLQPMLRYVKIIAKLDTSAAEASVQKACAEISP